MKKIIIAFSAVILLLSLQSCSTVPANWNAEDKTSYYRAAVVSGVYKKTPIASREGRYKDADDLENQFDKAFSRLFRRYSAQVGRRTMEGNDIKILAQAMYGRFEVQAMLLIHPDKTYTLKVASGAKKHNDRWCEKIKILMN
ncbi:MAG: hypothetical protein LBQ37_04095 [Elusimicrobiota bacterium]|jgi:hypothetical protein|nr:hypothetical protein [Elusimicrobiota bacterium]